MVDSKDEEDDDIDKCLRLHLRLMKMYMRVNGESRLRVWDVVQSRRVFNY